MSTPSSVAAQPSIDEQRQAVVDAIRTEHHLPALAVGCWRGGSTRACRVYVSGVRKVGESTAAPALITDHFIIGSCTKAMTTSVSALLIERGLLTWDRTLPQALPYLATRMHAAYSAVTIQMLCCHMSGLCREVKRRHYSALLAAPLEAARRSAAEILLSAAPEHAPGSRFKYSNAGYIVLGAIMEEATGKSWEELIVTELFEPLGITSYGFGCQADLLKDPPNQPWPHQWLSNGVCAPIDPRVTSGANPRWRGPAGAVFCSLNDWSKFAQLHMDGFLGRPTPVLQASSFKMLHSTPPSLVYTYGAWRRVHRKWAGTDGIGLTHSGGNKKGFATIWLIPSTDVAWLFATNVAREGGGDVAIDAAVDQMIALDRQMAASTSTCKVG